MKAASNKGSLSLQLKMEAVGHNVATLAHTLTCVCVCSACVSVCLLKQRPLRQAVVRYVLVEGECSTTVSCSLPPLTHSEQRKKEHVQLKVICCNTNFRRVRVAKHRRLGGGEERERERAVVTGHCTRHSHARLSFCSYFTTKGRHARKVKKKSKTVCSQANSSLLVN